MGKLFVISVAMFMALINFGLAVVNGAGFGAWLVVIVCFVVSYLVFTADLPLRDINAHLSKQELNDLRNQQAGEENLAKKL